MSEVTVRDLRKAHELVRDDGWNRGDADLVDGDILSIPKVNESNVLVRLDSGFTIRFNNGPIVQALAALKVSGEAYKKITLAEIELLVVSDVRQKEDIVKGSIATCDISLYKDGNYCVNMHLDTGYSIGMSLEPQWLNKICGGEDEH